MWEALDMTHNRSLETRMEKVDKNDKQIKTFAEVVLEGKYKVKNVQLFGVEGDEVVNDKGGKWVKVEKKRINDIILPRKKDRFNNRYGFIFAYNEHEAEQIITRFNDKKIMNKRLVISIAKGVIKKGGERSDRVVKESKVEVVETLSEKLILESILFIDVKEIGRNKFLFSFDDEEIKTYMDWNVLSPWFAEFKEVKEEDLLILRMANMEVIGLPWTAWSENNIRKLVLRRRMSGLGGGETWIPTKESQIR
ncbi:hypothetical protein POM88_024988 [Heracleum sosnowskyi]|uniref:RRM domain-containing protein n=1 Tax=Heracleum sosnowskyi TaxID=360622 RepID=A0AAD8MMR8_9APIA|nr:hypothetical protein POM88_024988 [Heracleum sosnowskyi]